MPVTEWNTKLDVSDLFAVPQTFTDFRDRIAARIREQLPTLEWATDLAEQLSHTDTEDEFDDVWDEFYDRCDDEHVWVQGS